MKILRQFGIILTISFLGEWLHEALPLPFPAGVYGIGILLCCLALKVLRVSDIGEACKFLLGIMPVLFIPAAVGIVTSWELLKERWLKYLLVALLSSAAVIAVTGSVTQGFIRHEKDHAE